MQMEIYFLKSASTVALLKTITFHPLRVAYKTKLKKFGKICVKMFFLSFLDGIDVKLIFLIKIF